MLEYCTNKLITCSWHFCSAIAVFASWAYFIVKEFLLLHKFMVIRLYMKKKKKKYGVVDRQVTGILGGKRIKNESKVRGLSHTFRGSMGCTTAVAAAPEPVVIEDWPNEGY